MGLLKQATVNQSSELNCDIVEVIPDSVVIAPIAFHFISALSFFILLNISVVEFEFVNDKIVGRLLCDLG